MRESLNILRLETCILKLESQWVLSFRFQVLYFNNYLIIAVDEVYPILQAVFVSLLELKALRQILFEALQVLSAVLLLFLCLGIGNL